MSRSRSIRHSVGATLFDLPPADDRRLDVFDYLHIDPLSAGWPDRFGAALRTFCGRRGRIRTLSLFSGAGGLDTGFHDAGFDIVDAVEMEARCCEALRASGCVSGTVHQLDIREFVPDPTAGYQFLIGGPPCQTFSAAGRRAAGVTGINDPRGTLFAEYVRILTAVRPVGFLFENVYGVTGANGGAAWRAMQAAFAAAGYHVSHRVLDAADYGVPQHRERLIVVGFRDGQFRFPRPTHGPDAASAREHYPAGTAIAGAIVEPESPSQVNGRYGNLLAQVPPGLNYSYFTERMGHPRPVFAWRSKFSDFLYKADPDRPVRTIKAQGGQYTGPFHWADRPFSVGEFKRLQTFPDTFALPTGRQAAVKMIGNSVPPQLARILAVAVRGQLFGEAHPWAMELLDAADALGFRRRKRLRTADYRQTATDALAAAPPSPAGREDGRSRTYQATLTDDFALEQRTDGRYRIEFRATKRLWAFGVGVPCSPASACVTVRPTKESTWALPVVQVQLYFSVADERTFTAAWKAFEAEVVRNGYKADLVQLNNYYQYPAALTAELRTQVGDDHWGVLAAVCGRRGVGRILTADELAATWDVPVGRVRSYARWLRGLGYEMRNENTNPELPAGSYLIPYAFPTFAPQSVQRRKRLDTTG